jgi:RNA polymerase sigma-70 factor (ECF subfamily)
MAPCWVKDVRVTDANPTERFERLYREHGDRLWRAIFVWSGDRQVADDAVAEAFTQALRQGDSLRDPMAWIWRVAFRLAAGELKDRRRHGVERTESSREPPESASEVFEALRRISPKQRAAVLLHHYAGYPVKDVARIIGSTPAAVRVHLSAGRRRLRELLKDDDG